MNSELTILTKDQAALVDQVKASHIGVRRSYEHQIQYALICGMQLIALKSTCEHGEFIRLRETHLPDVSSSAAGRYMDFFHICQTKFPAVGNLKGSTLLLEKGDLPAHEKETVLKAVYEAAEGKTWTAFYRDLDLCRQPIPHAHHPIKPQSPDEIIAAQNEQADSLLRAAESALGLLLDDLQSRAGTLAQRVPVKRWKDILRVTIQFNKIVRPLTKRRLSPAEKKESTSQKRWDKLAAKSRAACLADGGDLLAEGPITSHSSHSSH
jgi:hypothetical protein